LAAALLLCALALTTKPAMADTGHGGERPSIFAPSDSRPPENTA